MGETENLDVLRRYYEEVVNQGNLDAVDEVIAEGYVSHHNDPAHLPPGPAGVKAFVSQTRQGFPDLRWPLFPHSLKGAAMKFQAKTKPVMKAIPRIPVAVLLPGIVAALWVAPAWADVVTDWNVTAKRPGGQRRRQQSQTAHVGHGACRHV